MPHTPQPFHRPARQDWAIANLRKDHDDALYSVGEYAMFVIMWQIEDHEAGLVARCPVCYTSYGAVAEAFRQPARNECASCFGTTFDGGWKAQIVRPSIWQSEVDDPQTQRRGKVLVNEANVQSTSDVTLRTGDYAFRADGSRWSARTPQPSRIQTGFGYAPDSIDAIGFLHTRMARVPEDQVAFLIPPTTAEVVALLNQAGHDAVDWSEVDVVREGVTLP